jgi:predicted metalloprotease
VISRGHKGALLSVLAVACLALAGCGGDDDGASSAPEALTAEPVAGGYDESVDEIISLLDDYWAETLPDTFDTEYSSPSDAFAYNSDEGVPKCAGESRGAANASYCPADNTIAWDESGLMVPFYEEVGDAAVGFVLAHEWGHLIQNELGAKFSVTIESELNADCLAGDFAAALYDEGLIEGGTSLEPGTDLAEAADGIFLVGDDPGVPWQDPQAHGTGDERIEAFTTGFDGRAQACADELGPGFTEGA